MLGHAGTGSRTLRSAAEPTRTGAPGARGLVECRVVKCPRARKRNAEPACHDGRQLGTPLTGALRRSGAVDRWAGPARRPQSRLGGSDRRVAKRALFSSGAPHHQFSYEKPMRPNAAFELRPRSSAPPLPPQRYSPETRRAIHQTRRASAAASSKRGLESRRRRARSRSRFRHRKARRPGAPSTISWGGAARAERSSLERRDYPARRGL